MAKGLSAFVNIMAVPVMILNWIGGIVGGLWLAILGEWRVVGLGIGFSIIGPWILGLVMVCAMIFVPLLTFFDNKDMRIGSQIVTLISFSFNALVFTIWCLRILTGFVDTVNSAPHLPTLLWAYAVSTTPISYMASQEAQSDPLSPAGVTSFFVKIAFVFVVISIFFRATIGQFSILCFFLVLVGQFMGVRWSSDVDESLRGLELADETFEDELVADE